MYRSTFSTDIRADSTPLQGTQINAERDLGLDRSKPLQRFTIQWRPFERHEIAAIYFSASRNGSREINTPIVFNGQVYPARAQVTTDIGGLAVDARLLARRPGQTVTITETASTNVPVALIGLQGRVAFTPSLFGELSGGVLPHVHIDVYSGRALTGSARLEYRILHNLALGVAYNYFRISGTVSDPQFGGDLAMTIDGAEGYLRLAFGR